MNAYELMAATDALLDARPDDPAAVAIALLDAESEQ